MRRDLIFLTLGIIIGLSIHQFVSQKGAPPQQESFSANNSPIQKNENVIFNVELAQKNKIENLQNKLELKPLNNGLLSKANIEIKESEKTYGLIINEENVAEMERHRDQLRNYAYTIQTAEGWEIQILPEDKVFLKAGMSSGDLITFESMNAQLQNSERAHLAARMVTILNLVQR